MKNFVQLLLGKDLRSITKSNEVVRLVHDQESFDELFALLFHHERTLIMRAADAIEKITIKNAQFLRPHKKQILGLLKSAIHIELKWHVALLLPRLELNKVELQDVWHILSYWAKNPNESRIVRVNALQGLFELSQQSTVLRDHFIQIMQTLEAEPVPSIQARIRKLKKICT
jgi:hypothetical protein